MNQTNSFFRLLASNKLVAHSILSYTVSATIDFIGISLSCRFLNALVFHIDSGLIREFCIVAPSCDTADPGRCGITAGNLRLALRHRFGIQNLTDFYQFLFEYDCTIAGSFPLECLQLWEGREAFGRRSNDLDIYVPYRFKDSKFRFLEDAGFVRRNFRPVSIEAFVSQNIEDGEVETYLDHPIPALNIFAVATFVKPKRTSDYVEGLDYDVCIQMIVLKEDVSATRCVSFFDITVCQVKFSVDLIQVGETLKHGLCISVASGILRDIYYKKLRISKTFHLALQTFYSMCFSVTTALDSEMPVVFSSVYTFARTAHMVLPVSRRRIAKYVWRGYGYRGTLSLPRTWRLMEDQPFARNWSDGNTEIHYLCSRTCESISAYKVVFERVVRYFESYPQRTWRGAQGPAGDNVLHLACSFGHYHVVEHLLDAYPRAAGQVNDGGKYPVDCLMGIRAFTLATSPVGASRGHFAEYVEYAELHDSLLKALCMAKNEFDEGGVPRDLSGAGLKLTRRTIIGPIPTVRYLMNDFHGSPPGLF